MQTPVLFLIFNRPDTTAKVFEAIRSAQPPRLYVAGDGPREHRDGEVEKCRETRRIIEQVDWPCEIHTLFRDENLGCKRAVSGAVSWFFAHEPEGIVLEDDCMPNASFFRFCEEMLARYRHDQRIGQITGTCFFEEESFSQAPESYVFARHGSIWGWASWRRAWNHYDVALPDWSNMIQPRWLNSACPDHVERAATVRVGTRLVNGTLDTWDYQWTFTKLYYSLLSIVPTRNMILNVGWGAGATHTSFVDPNAPKRASELAFPLTHPTFVLPDATYENICTRRQFKSALGQKITSVMSRLRDPQYLSNLLRGR